MRTVFTNYLTLFVLVVPHHALINARRLWETDI